MDEFNAEENKPRSKAEILGLLRSEGDKFASWVETLTPEFLAETVTEPDGKTQKPASNASSAPRNTKCIIALSSC
jgi:hypothetical protein